MNKSETSAVAVVILAVGWLAYTVIDLDRRIDSLEHQLSTKDAQITLYRAAFLAVVEREKAQWVLLDNTVGDPDSALMLLMN